MRISLPRLAPMTLTVALAGYPAGPACALGPAALASDELTPAGTLRFPLSQQITLGRQKLESSPVLTVAAGLNDALEASFRFAFDSDINRQANEWEPRLTIRLLDLPVRLDLVAAYNSAAISADGALGLAYAAGPMRFRGSLRGFSSGLGIVGPTAAAGAGLDWQMNRWVLTAIDYGGIVATRDLDALASHLAPLGLVPTWRLAIRFGSDPEHALQLYVTDALSHTLQGLSHGGPDLRAGLEYRIPLDLTRSRPTPAFPPRSSGPVPAIPEPPAAFDAGILPDPPPLPPAPPMPPPAVTAPAVPSPSMAASRPPVSPLEPQGHEPHQGEAYPVEAPRSRPKATAKAGRLQTMAITSHGFAMPELVIKVGTQVRWVNQDRISHSVTGPGWDSRWMKPSRSFTWTFDRPGVFGYHCKVHPQHRGLVRVVADP